MFKKKNNFETPAEILTKNSSFKLKEAYNTLCTNVVYLPIEDKCKKLAVTSATYGEGKATVSINVASVLAGNMQDKRILLIDADMREAHVSEYIGDLLNDEALIGLSDYLSDDSAALNITSTVYPNLSFVSAGKPVLNPSGLLYSDKMKSMIEKLESEYDYIIIDTPPVCQYSDAILLLGRVNGYLLSARSNHSTVTSIDNAADVLTNAGAQIFGIVLSDVKNK